jgi:hypothetical protein
MKSKNSKSGQVRGIRKTDNESVAMKRLLNMQDEINKHLELHNRSVEDELLLILNKESKLPLRLRMFIISYCEFQLNQKQQQNEEPSIEGQNTVDVRSDLSDELHPGE